MSVRDGYIYRERGEIKIENPILLVVGFSGYGRTGRKLLTDQELGTQISRYRERYVCPPGEQPSVFHPPGWAG